jgi:hypothetical protein
VREALAAVDLVVTASLTAIECDRALVRGVTLGLLSEAAASQRRAMLARGLHHGVVFELDRAIEERARRAFPAEPLRTLDAIHMATAALAHSLVPELAVLSLDRRVRASAHQLGFATAPTVP